MEIKDFIILWTYSQWRQDLVVIPPLSREGNVLQASLYLHKVVSTIHHLASQTIRLKRQVWEQRFKIREKSANILRKNYQTGNLKSSLSDFRGRTSAYCPFASFRILAFYKETFHLPPSKSSDRRFCRPEPQACRPVKPCRDSHRLENGVAIFADSEQSSRPSPFSPERSCVWQLFHSFCILHRFL